MRFVFIFFFLYSAISFGVSVVRAWLIIKWDGKYEKKQALYITSYHHNFFLCHFLTAVSSISAPGLITVGWISFSGLKKKSPAFYVHCSEIPFAFSMLVWVLISHLPDQNIWCSGHYSFCSARTSTFSHPMWITCENTWEGTNGSLLIAGIQDISSTRWLNKSCLLYTL